MQAKSHILSSSRISTMKAKETAPCLCRDAWHHSEQKVDSVTVDDDCKADKSWMETVFILEILFDSFFPDKQIFNIVAAVFLK